MLKGEDSVAWTAVSACGFFVGIAQAAYVPVGGVPCPPLVPPATDTPDHHLLTLKSYFGFLVPKYRIVCFWAN